MSVKMRKVRISNVLIVPKNIEKIDKEYDIYEGRNGAIVYLSKHKNLFKDKEYVKKHQYNEDNTGFIDAEVDDSELL